MIQYRFIYLLLAMFVNNVFAQIETKPAETEFKPQMRAIDRNWSYFKSVPCDRVDKEVFHSRSEEILLAQRKSQCIDAYKAFLSKPLGQ